MVKQATTYTRSKCYIDWWIKWTNIYITCITYQKKKKKVNINLPKKNIALFWILRDLYPQIIFYAL